MFTPVHPSFTIKVKGVGVHITWTCYPDDLDMKRLSRLSYPCHFNDGTNFNWHNG